MDAVRYKVNSAPRRSQEVQVPTSPVQVPVPTLEPLVQAQVALMRPAETRESGANDETLGIIQVDLERRVLYANSAALRILGAADYREMTLNEIFPDPSAQDILGQQIVERRAGAITNYRISARRLADQREVPLEITGLPLRDSTGKVIGAIGVFRSLEQRELGNSIYRINKEIAQGNELLQAIGKALRENFRVDRMSVSRFSADGAHINNFFVFGQQGNRVNQKRWWPLSPDQQRWFDDDAYRVISDLPTVLEQEPWSEVYHEPAVQELLAAGIHSSLRRDVYRAGKRVGVLSLMSTKRGAFSDEDRATLDALPIDAAVIQALHLAERSRLEHRMALLKALDRCVTVSAACGTLAEYLVKMFAWSHVSIFRVDKAAGMVRMVTQHWERSEKISLPEKYEQPLTQGLLGRVISTRSIQNVGNVQSDPDYVRGVRFAQVQSELCVPILTGDDQAVRWIINVEDLRESAFSTDECDEVRELATEVSGVLQRISQLYFLTQCFDHTSDPIIVTDANLRITKTNRAAAVLLQFDNPRMVKGNLADYFVEPDAEQRLAQERPNIGELSMRCMGEAVTQGMNVSTVPVFVLREELPEGIGGWIFVARDTRGIRRAIELELLETAAYEVAVETSSPLALAIAELQRLMRSDSVRSESIAKVLRRLSRVRDGYTKLALYNASARPKGKHRYPVDLGAEVESVVDSFTDAERALVCIDIQRPFPVIYGDHFQISVILEALLASLVRSVPEDDPVVARVANANDHVEIRLCGRKAGAGPATEREASRIESEVHLAYQLVRDFMGNHGGTFEERCDDTEHVTFVLRFPCTSRSAS